MLKILAHVSGTIVSGNRSLIVCYKLLWVELARYDNRKRYTAVQSVVADSILE